MLLSLLTTVLFAPEGPRSLPEKPAIVRLIQSGPRFTLMRNGKPYFVKGAGAQSELETLVKAGGNSVRTWGADEKTNAFLDKSHKLGLTVTVGFWLRKGYDNFSYLNGAQVKEQFDYIKKYVKQLQNHPALLCWAVGNEMELGLPAEQTEAMWKHVNDVAKMMKQEDPGRPVMSVVADMWPEKMAMILKHCPELDLLGVNSYGGLPTLQGRMKPWKKPYIVTEFQNAGAADGANTDLKLPIEPSSTEKARELKWVYENNIKKLPGRVLGSYVFYWDRSGTQTASLYSMHLKSREKLESVDVMTRMWSGKWPTNRAPQILAYGPVAGSEREFMTKASDPDGDTLRYELEIVNEDKPRFVGDFEQDLGVVVRKPVGNRFALPNDLEPGRYRAYIIVRDGKGSAATWNMVFRSKG